MADIALPDAYRNALGLRLMEYVAEKIAAAVVWDGRYPALVYGYR
jgi:hypothetical protein